MKVCVDQEECTGCGLCADACPEIFKIGEDTATVMVEAIPSGQEDCIRQAAEDCPVEAIHVEEET